MINNTRTLRVWMWAVTGALLMVLTGCGPSAVERDSTPDTPAADPIETILAIDSGSATVAPTFQKDQWQLMLEETVTATAQTDGDWRDLDYTAIEVGPAAQLTVPDSEAYEFLDAESGDEVWVLPPYEPFQDAEETTAPSLGLSAEAPEVLRSVGRGVTFSLTGMEGPGTLATYTQTGFFGEPEPLWDSRGAFPQPHWVPTETHAPLGWVFTEPGIYLAQVTVHGELIDGSKFSDTQVLRFAVGSDLDAEEAVSIAWSGPSPEPYFEPGAAVKTTQQGTDTTGWLLIGAIALCAALLLTGVVQLLRRQLRITRASGQDNPYLNTGETE